MEALANNKSRRTITKLKTVGELVPQDGVETKRYT